jgi:hypothetical protein|tara:strand:- start:2261 stop:2578 length:318 start_codon:yes stop_codon:yes gene_type:complete
MSIKIVIFSNGDQVISDVKEVVVEDEFKAYQLIQPQKVFLREHNDTQLLMENADTRAESIEMVLSAWVPLSKEKQFYVAANSVISITEPIEDLVKIYKEKVGIDD